MTKIGAHVAQGPRNGYGDFCRALPAVVLAVDDGGALLEVKQHSPNTVTVFRQTSVYLEAPPQFNTAPDMVALARQYYPALKAKWQQNEANFYTLTNEQASDNTAVMQRLVTYERELMRLANLDGFKVVILNLATGTPGDISLWKQLYAPFIREAWAGGNAYGRHVYGEGDLVNPNGSVIAGDPARPFEELGHLRSLGATGKIILTECGLDAGFGFSGVDRFVAQINGYSTLLSQFAEFVGLCAWALGNWSGANWQAAIPALIEVMDDPQPIPPPVVPPPAPPPVPPPSTYQHMRLIAAANIRRDASTSKPAITSQPVKEGLELIKVADVTGQAVSGDNRWVKAVAFLSRSYVTDSAPGKVKTNRSVNLRVLPTTSNNWPIATLPIGVEFESIGNVKDLYNNGLWVAVALYVWRPLAIDVTPGIRLGSPLRIPLTITSPFGSPRSYPFAPNKRQTHEGEDWHTGGAIPVLAMESGTVDFIRSVDPGYGYGLTVRIKHSDRYKSWYGHLSQIQVTPNQTVTKGQQIALSGRSGGSVHHLHCTVQDIPSGLDNYVIDDCCDFTLLMHPAVSLLPAPAPPVPTPGNKIDVLPYLKGDGRIYTVKHPPTVENPDGAQEDFQTQAAGNVFYQVKNSQYEALKYDDQWIYRGLDTSPGPAPKEAERPGELRLYKQFEPGQQWAKWCPRYMAVGETWTGPGHYVQFRYKSDCAPSAINSGPATNQITLVAKHASKTWNGFRVDNVVELKTNTGETMFGGFGFGLVGWGAGWGGSGISEVSPPGRPPLEREVIPCL